MKFFDPFIDQDGILHVSGRLIKSNDNYDKKHKSIIGVHFS